MSFALAIRNTVSEARQAMLTTTSLIVIVTVITQGGATNFLLKFFQIPWVIQHANNMQMTLSISDLFVLFAGAHAGLVWKMRLRRWIIMIPVV